VAYVSYVGIHTFGVYGVFYTVWWFYVDHVDCLGIMMVNGGVLSLVWKERGRGKKGLEHVMSVCECMWKKGGGGVMKYEGMGILLIEIIY
jgi:hypothetical protein